jgi:hypothetical protein
MAMPVRVVGMGAAFYCIPARGPWAHPTPTYDLTRYRPGAKYSLVCLDRGSRPSDIYYPTHSLTRPPMKGAFGPRCCMPRYSRQSNLDKPQDNWA